MKKFDLILFSLLLIWKTILSSINIPHDILYIMFTTTLSIVIYLYSGYFLVMLCKDIYVDFSTKEN
jgi:hypothetical protein